MAVSCKTQISDFNCPKGVVWHLLTSADSYKDWYGYPETLDLIDTVPDFSLGAKLIFNNGSITHIVTEYDLQSRLAISTATETNEFTLKETDFGCRVMLTTKLTSDGASFNGTEGAHEAANAQVLSQLKAAAYAYEDRRPEYAVDVELKSKRKKTTEVVSAIIQGYKSPEVRKPAEKDETPAALSENTESDIRFTARAAVIALLAMVVLFSVLLVSLGFERSDIVPSSGLSIMENENVNKEKAAQIYIGQKKTELELMLSCTGLRISPDEYCYSSAERRDNGQPCEQIFVIYDSYGTVRRFGYVDYLASAADFSCDIKRYDRYVSPGMNVIDIEERTGFPCSAFYVDKSGVTCVYFGAFNTKKSVFSDQQKSELVIKLDTASKQVDAQFYLPYDRSNPMPMDEITKKLKRQYSNFSLYLADKLSTERAFLIFGRPREEVDIILDTKNTAITEISNGEMKIYGKYVLIGNEHDDRYKYAANYYYDGIAEEVSFENLTLQQKDGMLGEYEDYGLRVGMSRYFVYDKLGILPSEVSINYTDTVLCYGKKIGTFKDIKRNYELVLVFDTTTDQLSEITVNY